jgi:quinol monooxygenase YgiN
MTMRMKFNIILVLSFILFASNMSFAQDNRVIRIARIKIDPTYLDSYKTAIREQIETAVKVEPGVIMLYAVHDKAIPTNVTVFEIYADTPAYKLHIQTEHFKKYKTGTAHMVKSLELVDVSAIELGQKK